MELASPLANSPLLPLLLMSLATQKNAPNEATTFDNEYDYIVVGAGSAGSVVASRLSEEPCVSVLLLEAGHGAPVLNDVPALGRYYWFTDIDWKFKTVPQKKTGKSLVNRQVIWPSGKGIGGSSLLNGMFTVRGNRKNYDDWAAQGAEGWSYDDVLPYFRKLEDNQDYSNEYHGSGGPVTVERPRYTKNVRTAIEDAAKELGYPIGDANGARQTGFYDYQATIRDSQRCSTAKAYLVPAENRTNLAIVGGAHVKKILMEGTEAYGVAFDYNKMAYEVKARREVILSAGTTNSAQILMLSGIGPKKHLEDLNIDVVADLPVGDNFQDHCGGILPYTMNSGVRPINDEIKDNKTIEEYINKRTGQLGVPENIDIMAFLNAKSAQPEEDFPDYQLYYIEIAAEIAKAQVGLTDFAYKAVFGFYEKDPILVCVSQILHPKSRGTVRLNSSDPYDPPLIDPNYLDDPADMKDIVNGLKTCFKLGNTKAMEQIDLRIFKAAYPNCYIYILFFNKFLECLVENAVVTFSHQVGTCKMGDPNDNTTVVDPQLRVKGIDRLRVVDASIMPIVPSGNTNIPTIMVAEKASDIIKKTITCQ